MSGPDAPQRRSCQRILWQAIAGGTRRLATPTADAVSTGREITAELARWSEGDARAIDAIFLRAYDQLHAVAERVCAGERSDHTLGVTGLLHELYLELTPGAPGSFANRRAFFALAACVMRRALVDHSRRHSAQRRGGNLRRIPLHEARAFAGRSADEIVDLDDALRRLESLDRRKAQVVELRFFTGLSMKELACILDLSERTVAREWRLARAMLRRLLDGQSGRDHESA